MSDSELHVPAWVEPFMRNLRPELRAKLSLRDIDDLWRAASAATEPARIKDRQEWRAALRTAHEENKQLRARVAELEAGRSSEREVCARDVCMYCSRRARRYGPAVGPNPAGNYVHQHDETGRTVLCHASAIWSRHAALAK